MTATQHKFEQRKFGLLLVACSVVLVSAAQLLLKIGASRIDHTLPVLMLPLQITVAFPIGIGMLCYALSVVIWQRALAELPLSIAYPLLGVSYPLVYICALLLPNFTETFSAARSIGILLTLAGVALLAPPQKSGKALVEPPLPAGPKGSKGEG